jgi:hypothetical protein
MPMAYNGLAVEGVNVGGVSSRPITTLSSVKEHIRSEQAAMSQFLQIPAKDKRVSVEGFQVNENLSWYC